MANGNPASQQMAGLSGLLGGGVGGGAGLLASPLFLPLLLSFGPSLISKLFGGDPQKELERRIARLQSPQNIGKVTQGLYQNVIGSPAFSQAQGTIAAGANAGAGQLASELGARGIGTTGTGAVLSSLTPSIVGSQMAGLRTGAYNSAQQQALQQIQAQIARLTGQGPSQTQQLFAGGLSSIAPFFQQYLGSRYPSIFGTSQQGMAR